MIITPFQRLLNRGLLRLQRSSEIARFDGIILADTQDSTLFRKSVLAALHLIKQLDSRRSASFSAILHGS